MIAEGRIDIKVEFGDMVVYRGQEFLLEDVVYRRHYDSGLRERYVRYLVLKGVNGLIFADPSGVTAPYSIPYDPSIMTTIAANFPYESRVSK